MVTLSMTLNTCVFPGFSAGIKSGGCMLHLKYSHAKDFSGYSEITAYMY